MSARDLAATVQSKLDKALDRPLTLDERRFASDALAALKQQAADAQAALELERREGQKALVAQERETAARQAQLDAATTMLAEAERIVPGVITTAGRFSIGLNDRERAVRAEEALRQAHRLGDKLANAAERLEENPLANCLPRFRYPVVDAVGAWRDAREKAPAAAGADTPHNQREETHADDGVNRTAVVQTDAGAEDPQRVPPPASRRATALHPNASGAPQVPPLGESPVAAAGADTEPDA